MTTEHGGRPRQYLSDTCIIDGCDMPRKAFYRQGAGGWHSKFCDTHYREDVRNRHRAKRASREHVEAAALKEQPIYNVDMVYTAWGRGVVLGIVRYEDKRVYGLKPVANGYRATVTGMESVLLLADTPLSVWGRE